MPRIEPRTILVEAGRLDVKRGGVETIAQSAREEQASYGRTALPDVLGYLQNHTELTRATLLAILQKSGRLDDVFVDAQSFLDQAVAAIQDTLNTLIVDGIRYQKRPPDDPDAAYEMSCFKNQELFDYLNSLATAPDKSLYDFVEYESEVERAFANELNERPDIKLFVKLPRWFVVDTPVGEYNPDWAIVKPDSTAVYMVRETKSTKDFRKRRGLENDKVRCGEQHFKELNVSFAVVTSADEIR